MKHKIENFTLIFGAMKCGTTSLFRYLSEHPEISACKAKEPNYFSHEKSWNKGFKYYQTLWDYKPDIHHTALEATTNYSKIPRLPNCAQRIYETAQQNKVDFKLVYILRDPVDRIISHCVHDLQAQWSVRYNHPIIHGIPYPAIEISKYAMQLDEYYNRFSEDQILILNSEKLKKSPKESVYKVCKFLGVNPDFSFPEIKHNSSTEKRVTNRNWSFFNKYFASPVAARFPHNQRQQVLDFFMNLFESQQEINQFQLNDEQLGFIAKELSEDIKKLKQEYGIDVSSWKIQI